MYAIRSYYVRKYPISTPLTIPTKSPTPKAASTPKNTFCVEAITVADTTALALMTVDTEIV